MDIFIEKLQKTDADNLFAFELENRLFFEKMVLTRGDDYYNVEVFKERHQALLDEQATGESCFYLIKDKDHSILGRMNLVDIAQGIGHLGYRVGQVYTGKGVANNALRLLLEKVIIEDEIIQINAKTTTNNIASQRVLDKNGFKKLGICDEVVEMNGQKLKFVYYSRKK